MPAPDLLRSAAVPGPAGAAADPGVAAGPAGVVVLLHGGAKTGTQALAETRSASRWRADRMRRVLEPRLRSARIESYLLTYSVRGWNDGLAAEPSPVPDARWAIEQVTGAHPGAPVVLLGHSMGARTAVRVADHPAVVGVVGLAPWFEPGDPVAALAGRHLVVAHGSRDRITSARATRAYVGRAARVAASADFADLGRLGHYMLARPATWNRFALRSVLDVLDRAAAPRRTAAG